MGYPTFWGSEKMLGASKLDRGEWARDGIRFPNESLKRRHETLNFPGRVVNKSASVSFHCLREFVCGRDSLPNGGVEAGGRFVKLHQIRASLCQQFGCFLRVRLCQYGTARHCIYPGRSAGSRAFSGVNRSPHISFVIITCTAPELVRWYVSSLTRYIPEIAEDSVA